MNTRLKEIASLRAFLEEPAPSILMLVGRPRSGRSWLLRQGTAGRDVVRVRGSGLPAPVLARELARSVQEQLPELAREEETGAAPVTGESPWSPLFRALQPAARRPLPITVVVDDADPLLRDRRFVRDLGLFFADLRAHARQVRVVLAVDGDPSPLAGEEHADRWLPGLEPRHLPLHPLTLREAASAVPDWSAEDVVTVFGLVGGLPDFWSRVDGSVRPSTNLARLLLSPDAPLRGLPDALLPEASRRSERDLALVRALAAGAATWGELRREAGVFRTSSELGPYVKGLVDGGVAAVSASLDSGPRSRGRRYRLIHPLLALWHRSVHPRLAELDGGAAPGRVISERMGSEIPVLVARALPGMVGSWLEEYGRERFPAGAREVGSLWGEGYEIPVAATLTSGAAVYGRLHWTEAPASDALDDLLRQVRVTRYGFGREARLPLLLTREEPGHELSRRAAQVAGAVLLRPGDLVGRP